MQYHDVMLPSCWNAPVKMIYKEMDFPIGHNSINQEPWDPSTPSISPECSDFSYKSNCLRVCSSLKRVPSLHQKLMSPEMEPI